MGRGHPREVKEEPVTFTYRPELEDVNRARELPGEVKKELPKQGMEREDDKRTRERPDEAKEERPKVEAPVWEVFTPSKVKGEPVEFTYRPELEDVNKTRELPWRGQGGAAEAGHDEGGHQQDPGASG